MTRLTLLLVALALVWPAPVTAQTRASTGEIAGLVRDSTGSVLPGVTVTATHVETNVSRLVTTDQAGRFTLAGLPVGAYTVRAALQAFADAEVENVAVLVGDRVELAFTMVVAAIAVELTVQAVPPVDVTATSVSSVVSGRQIADLPINGRNFLSFAQLSPGVAPDRGVADQETSGLTFVGQRGRANNISVDGLDNNGVNLGTVRGTISQDAVEEFQVLTTSYGAEFGKAAGGLVNIVTRSGTNTTSGSAFLYGRDDNLNGREFDVDAGPGGSRVSRGKAPFNQQQFGATIGGPIARDRLFYFAAFERQRTRGSRFVSIDDTTVIGHPFAPVPLGTAVDILRAAGLPVSTGFQPYETDNRLFLGKVDAHGRQSWIAGRLHGASRTHDLVEPFGGIVDRSRALRLHTDDVQGAAWWTSAPSDRWLHDLRVQVAREQISERSLDPACGGTCDAVDVGGPAVDVLGVASVGRNTATPASSDYRYLQVLDTVSWFGRRHDVRAGVDIGYRRVADSQFPLNFGGQFVFADLPAPVAALFGLPGPVSSIQAVALGLPVVYVRGYGRPDVGSSSNHDVSLFVQDDWRPTDSLTIKAGLRYQRQGFSARAFDVPGVENRFTFPADNNNVAPRLAIAWDPGGARPTVLRASYGISYERTLGGVESSAVVLNPVSGIRTLVGLGAVPLTAWALPGHQLPEALAGPFAPTTISVDPGLRTPYAHQSSFGFEREIGQGLVLSADAVFVEGRAQVGVIDYNPLVPALGPGRRPDDLDDAPGTSGPVLQYTSFGESSYRGLLVSASRRYTGRTQWMASYTLSKAEDNSTDFTLLAAEPGAGRDPGDPLGLPVGFDPAGDRGPSAQDQRHRLVVSGMYDFPRGVSVATLVTMGSGRPFAITAGQDLNGDGTPDSDRPRVTLDDPTSAIGRNAGRLPAEATVDVRLSWRHRLAGRVSLEWIAEAFNLFNRVNVLTRQGVFGPGPYPANPAPGFGASTLNGAPRQIQLAVRVRF